MTAAAGIIRPPVAWPRVRGHSREVGTKPSMSQLSQVAITLPGAALTSSSAVEAARRGEAAGWDWLFDRYYSLVCRYVMARADDRELVEDIAQEVFVAAVRTIASLRDTSEPGIEGWLLGIARNKAIDVIRRRRRQRPEGGAPPAAPDAAEMAVSRLSAFELRRAMERLNDDQRDVLVRRFVLDQSLEQVAAATGRPVGAVKSMQHRALAALARHLPEEQR
ncbi:MAG: sigma-70 family RNA polymerase sigma factor [Chloroflexi bacterium]|nr:MAG: sigma-70 family RNA polymerase sigma factor [Chloroflexota bacterium]